MISVGGKINLAFFVLNIPKHKLNLSCKLNGIIAATVRGFIPTFPQTTYNYWDVEGYVI